MIISRRNMLKLGLVGGTGLAVLPGVPWQSLNRAYATARVASPPVKPFQVALPVLPVLQPVSRDSSTDYYHITQKAGQAHILPGLTTPIWGYNGIFPGPTIEAKSFRRVVIRQTNALPVPTTTHLHGGHTPPQSDGDPTDLVSPGSSKDYIYPNRQRASTLWYHDHRMDFTGPQVYKGLAGFYLLRDEIEESFPLPRGEHDIPLMITDRFFNADGSFFYPALDPSLSHTPGVLPQYGYGVFGDTILVNGAVQPFLQVSTTKYRFRILNASGARLYELALSSGQPFIQIGSDGGLLPAPVRRQTLLLASAERNDVIIDFSRCPVGSQIIMKNLHGRGRVADIMRFDVVRKEKDDYAIPATLTPIAPIDPAKATVTRSFEFLLGQGMWTINGKHFDPNYADARPRLNSTEIWEFTGDANHPIHIHDIMFQVLSRNGRRPAPGDAGWKDTFLLSKGERVRIIATFTDYRGPYVFHCHNLEHEDMGMMGRFVVE
ncbi:MAG: multicopper oxidase domain-containing protein [Ktedonobacteraceae bacterium]|nr:multicopper oxidase domain-containing protein [Ktedonobacteraceae bacterium]